MPYISVEGASLIAQTLPIAILIIVIEARASARYPRVKVNKLFYSRASSVITGGGALLGLSIVVLCWIGVNQGEPLPAVSAWIVAIGTPLVVADAGVVLIDLIDLLVRAERVGIEKAEREASTPMKPPGGERKRKKRKG